MQGSRGSQQPAHTAQQYGGGTSVPAGSGHANNTNSWSVPAVPVTSGQGHDTSVDTASLDVFANNIDLLIAPTRTASTTLGNVGIAPGAFYHANQMRTSVNGPNGDAGLKEQYIKTLADLGQGLADLRDGVRQLSAQYTTIEDANTMTATDFQSAMSSSQGDFTQMMTDAGGSGSSSTSSGS
ncbi:hypothetical protein GXW83_16790 [Streptacidiphilus sp. PB12-B1b]|uniref:hypothetical protein n=1 Tax=Streptacidiphilus sp. PB12-B1b TaxID=2705012 RepID=UPI0015FB9EA5|nr:hypothetical protein [Streptacidiphilus sp. PB12-B1b]QMU77120.1 hypothetical protein GXW83_16790 [Streptacidiphilus sp. PB12-B1b]